MLFETTPEKEDASKGKEAESEPSGKSALVTTNSTLVFPWGEASSLRASG